ncbi:MAG: hypothetical protein JWO94_2671 [Verrucomicrobiaceae bacterium]|nr:hypothetical protein [Verrucomicrobiaceae bacterium]
MSASTYLPVPLDTSMVVLSPDLAALTEKLAENAHELWSQERISQGWKCGPERSDARKEHPGLVPYDELPKPEQQFDRNTALGTLKAILAMGYQILPPPMK